MGCAQCTACIEALNCEDRSLDPSNSLLRNAKPAGPGLMVCSMEHSNMAPQAHAGNASPVSNTIRNWQKRKWLQRQRPVFSKPSVKPTMAHKRSCALAPRTPAATNGSSNLRKLKGLECYHRAYPWSWEHAQSTPIQGTPTSLQGLPILPLAQRAVELLCLKNRGYQSVWDGFQGRLKCIEVKGSHASLHGPVGAMLNQPAPRKQYVWYGLALPSGKTSAKSQEVLMLERSPAPWPFALSHLLLIDIYIYTYYILRTS